MKYSYLPGCGLLFLGMVWASTALANEEITPQKVLQAVDAIRAPGENFIFNLDVEQQDGEDSRVFQFHVKVKDNEKSLVTYIKPVSSRGRRVLMVGENLWVYIPKTRRAIRISARQKVSSGISNADVARVIYSLDYHAEALVETEFEGQASYQLFLTARTKGAAYQRIELWVSKEDYRPLKAEFFTQTGRRLKSIHYQDYQLVLGKQRPMRLEVLDEANQSQKTLMHYRDMAIETTQDHYFQHSYLPRLPL